MSRPRATLPLSVAAVAMLAEQAQLATGRPMPEAEVCELMAEAREMQFRQLAEAAAAPLPPAMICYSGTAMDAVMEGRHDGGDWYNRYWERYADAHPQDPRAFAAAHGLTGDAADMFTRIATAIQNAKGDVPW